MQHDDDGSTQCDTNTLLNYDFQDGPRAVHISSDFDAFPNFGPINL